MVHFKFTIKIMIIDVISASKSVTSGKYLSQSIKSMSKLISLDWTLF